MFFDWRSLGAKLNHMWPMTKTKMGAMGAGWTGPTAMSAYKGKADSLFDRRPSHMAPPST